MNSAKQKLLVVDDDRGIQKQLRWSLDDYQVVVAGDRESALAQVERHHPSVVTLDLGLPPDADGASEGLATLEQILQRAPGTKVIVVSGNQDRENAVKAVGMGAYDFYQKPIDPEILGLIVGRAFSLTALESENRRLSTGDVHTPLEGIITGAESMLTVCRTVEKVASAEATTLLLGESGTGKELLARALHDLSPRSAGPFVAINCAAIPENLLESELFGHEKGAFTGAVKLTKGKVEMAEGGTLFLDEIGDLPLPLQVKLLRFLQERVIERVGGRKQIPVDVRVVCATHRFLEQLMEEGNFRQDLYYRIGEVRLRIPPLRERAGDVLLLARTFLARFSRQLKRPIKGIAPEAMAALEAYEWPGNVRELENRIKRAVIMAEERTLSAADLELEVPAAGPSAPISLREAREQAEREAVQRVLSLHHDNLSRAADVLEVSRPTLYSLIKKYNLSVSRGA